MAQHLRDRGQRTTVLQQRRRESGAQHVRVLTAPRSPLACMANAIIASRAAQGATRVSIHDFPGASAIAQRDAVGADPQRVAIAGALRDAEATVLAFLGDVAFDGSVCGIKQAIVKGMFARLQAHAAEAAQAQAQAAEPVGFEEWMDRDWPLWRNDPNNPNVARLQRMWNDTHPQPAQDASKYQELLMAVEKKFPGESRHETALRYIRETELQSCEPKCDAAMAKESGR